MKTTARVLVFGIVLFTATLPLSGCGEGVERESASVHDSAVAEDTHVADAEPATLLAIMRRLGTEMMSLTYGLMTDSTAQVASSANAIAEHVPITDADLRRIQGELDADFAEFERIDHEVHESLVRLQEAAASGRTGDVLTRLNEAQRGCVECHARFRERLRTNR